jgi:cell division protein FtsQ
MAAATPPIDIRLMNSAASLLFIAAVLSFVVIGVRWFVRLPLFHVQAIQVDGDTTHNGAPALRSHVLPRMEGNVFTMDLAQAKRAFETVPWVRRAIVRRVWPNRLAVTLEEHRAAAYWHEDEGNEQLVNTHGEAFEANVGDVEDEGLPLLAGPEGTAAQVLDMHRRLDAVFTRLATHVESLTLGARGSWRVELDNGGKVELGRGTDDELLARAQAFVDTLPQLTARYQAPLLYADLRHRDGYAVRLKGIVTNPDAASTNTPKAAPAAR